jgi:predicted flavoprotein YhiN
MPTAIYISGLGKSANKESVEKFVTRYIKELEYCNSGIKYYTKVEKIYYNKMYQSYWEESKSGQSYTRLIFNKMKELNYFSITT